MGSKIEAKRLMRAAGVPVLPDNTVESLAEIGLPALVKASAGGGGRGMRIVRDAGRARRRRRQRPSAKPPRRSATAPCSSSGSSRAAATSRSRSSPTCTATSSRCSSATAPCSAAIRRSSRSRRPRRSTMRCATAMSAAAVAAAPSGRLRRCGHGRVPRRRRRQVLVPGDEHPPAGRASGHGDDHRARPRRVAAAPSPAANRCHDAALHPTITGHAIEVRLCAEDPDNGYLPELGHVPTRIEFAEIDGVRVDSGVASGSVVSPFYDSMIAKVIAHAPTRAGAINKLQRALGTAHLIGPITNRSQLLGLLPELADRWQEIDTGWLDRHPPTATRPSTPAFVAAAALAWGRATADGVEPTFPPAGATTRASRSRCASATSRRALSLRPRRLGRRGVVDGVPVDDGWLPALGFIETRDRRRCRLRVAWPAPVRDPASVRATRRCRPRRVARSRRCRARSCGCWSVSATWWSPASHCWRWRR